MFPATIWSWLGVSSMKQPNLSKSCNQLNSFSIKIRNGRLLPGVILVPVSYCIPVKDVYVNQWFLLFDHNFDFGSNLFVSKLSDDSEINPEPNPCLTHAIVRVRLKEFQKLWTITGGSFKLLVQIILRNSDLKIKQWLTLNKSDPLFQSLW